MRQRRCPGDGRAASRSGARFSMKKSAPECGMPGNSPGHSSSVRIISRSTGSGSCAAASAEVWPLRNRSAILRRAERRSAPTSLHAAHNASGPRTPHPRNRSLRRSAAPVNGHRAARRGGLPQSAAGNRRIRQPDPWPRRGGEPPTATLIPAPRRPRAHRGPPVSIRRAPAAHDAASACRGALDVILIAGFHP